MLEQNIRALYEQKYCSMKQHSMCTSHNLYFIVALSCRNKCSSSSNCRNYKKNKISVTSCNEEEL